MEYGERFHVFEANGDMNDAWESNFFIAYLRLLATRKAKCSVWNSRKKSSVVTKCTDLECGVSWTERFFRDFYSAKVHFLQSSLVWLMHIDGYAMTVAKIFDIVHSRIIIIATEYIIAKYSCQRRLCGVRFCIDAISFIKNIQKYPSGLSIFRP